MDKTNRLIYFKGICDEIKKCSIQEIESGLIYYIVKKLSLDNDNVLINNITKNANAINSTLQSVLEKYNFPTDIEIIIEFFEFLIDRDCKTENGVIFTPKYISDYIVKECFTDVLKWDKNIRIIDPGCGCGIFLISAIEFLHNKFEVPIIDIIKNNIFGIDIVDDNIRRCKYVLILYCLMRGLQPDKLDVNLLSTNSLESDWTELFNVPYFDYVIGNPPYVNTHDMNKTTIKFLKENFKTTKNGVFNIFYAFIEHGLKQLSETGHLGFIIPNNFLTIKSAEALRELLQRGGNINIILDFYDNMVFKPVRTYSCIIKLSKERIEEFEYAVMDKVEDISVALKNIVFNKIDLNHLDKNGWNLVDTKTLSNLRIIESQRTPIKEFIRTGIATLRDGIYLVNKDANGYYKEVNNTRYFIEKEIVKPIYKIPDLKKCNDVKDVVQYIIFPYVKGLNGFELIDETAFQETHPCAYYYLLSMKSILDERDKGKPNSSGWYAYGRTQGLNKYGKKLMFPTFSNKPKFIYVEDDSALFCNGYAIFENNVISLPILQKILNSAIMNYYVKNTSYSIEGGYYCYQKKYIERFSIPFFTDNELNKLENGSNIEIDSMLIEKYGISI